MNILLITPYLPYPPISGGRLQTFLRIKKLKEKGHNIYLAAIAEFGVKREYIKELKKYVTELKVVFPKVEPQKIKYLLKKSLIQEIFSFVPGFEKEIKSFIRDREIDIAVYEGVGSAQYREATKNVPNIIYEHNVEYEIIEHLVESLRISPSKVLNGRIDEKLKNIWLYLFGGREKKLAKKYELESLKKYDMFITCSERDAAILQKDVKDVPNAVVPWSIEIASTFNAPQNKDVYDLLFVGSMYWEPNRDAITWFAKEIFPLIRKKVKNLRLMIVGSYPSKEIQKLDNNKDITVKGFIPDIAQAYLDADIFIAPIRMGSGVNVKIIEAMSYGIPVVTTSKGAEGLDAVAGEHFLLANTSDEFLSSIQYLTENVENRKTVGLRGREYVSKYHDIDRVIVMFEEVLIDVRNKWKRGQGSNLYS